MIEELKPCPFCGGAGMVYSIYARGKKVYKAMCGARVDCCCLLNDWDSPEEAVLVWNKRNEET